MLNCSVVCFCLVGFGFCLFVFSSVFLIQQKLFADLPHNFSAGLISIKAN